MPPALLPTLKPEPILRDQTTCTGRKRAGALNILCRGRDRIRNPHALREGISREGAASPHWERSCQNV